LTFILIIIKVGYSECEAHPLSSIRLGPLFDVRQIFLA
jgi:hypothetical protein